MMRSFYLLERRGGTIGGATTDFLQTDPHNVGDGLLCETCGRGISMLRWEPPFRVEIETWGSCFGDLAFGPGDEFLASERFKALWEQAGLIGLHGFEPVEIVKVRHRRGRIRKAPPQYVSVWAGHSDVAVDEARSGIQWVSPPDPPCEVCRGGGIKKGCERIVLEGEPRENVFEPRGLGVLLADERFKRFCEEHAISNCPLIPAEQASRWF